MRFKAGNCGWFYLNCENYFGADWKEKFGSKLKAYCKLFDLVEINSTFYRIPQLNAVRQWREEADAINPRFEFTVKVSRIITHQDRFSSEKSLRAFEMMMGVADALKAKILLFQSPDSFTPTKENIKNAVKFFDRVERGRLLLAWEVRWPDKWTGDLVKELFQKIGVNQCVDPLRQECYHAEGIFYWRLHGFGNPMYNYSFSEQELDAIAGKIKANEKPTYVLFNNGACYENCLKLKELIQRP